MHDKQSLSRMANQIGQFFEAMPDRAEALADAAAHLRKFWEPRMRAELLRQVEAGSAALSDFMVEAIARHGESLRPATPVASR